MSAHRVLQVLVLGAALALAACGDKAQTASAGGAKKPDSKAYEGVQSNVFTADGWKAGDKDSWEAQMKARAQRGQNEYSRSTVAEAKTQ